MSSSRVVIAATGLVKHYRTYDRPHDRLKEAMLPGILRAMARMTGLTSLQNRARRHYYHESPAINGLSVDIEAGEFVGILGRNGSGKSTLLQLIASILAPTSGAIRVEGRVAALLELGTGFSPDFTGRENILLNGAVVDLDEGQMQARMGRIVEFAEIGEYVDRPVREYSSGMFVRLAFATAIHVDAEILIVDEVLAVGDAKFQLKCFQKIEQLRRQGVTILLVTHSIDQVVRHCSRGIVLDAGSVAFDGPPRDAANHYMSLLFGRQSRGTPHSSDSDLVPPAAARHGGLSVFPVAAEARFEARSAYSGTEHRWGDRRVEILDFALLVDGEPIPALLHFGQTVELLLRVRFRSPIARPVYGFFIRTLDGVIVYGANSRGKQLEQPFQGRRDGDVVLYGFCFPTLLAGGDYVISVGVSEDLDGTLVPLDRRYDSIMLAVSNPGNYIGICDLGAEGQLIE